VAADPGQEYAERPKEGELWHQLIERQQKEGGNQDGYLRERLRSLPDEQQKDKEQERGDSSPFDSSPVAEMQSYYAMIREASQRAVPDQSQELER
jgi:hypothetical protein